MHKSFEGFIVKYSHAYSGYTVTRKGSSIPSYLIIEDKGIYGIERLILGAKKRKFILRLAVCVIDWKQVINFISNDWHWCFVG